MANEAAVTVVMRMKDEASTQMQQFGDTTQQTQIQALQFNMALTAMGSAFTAVGSLVNQLENPMAKMAGTFLMTAGAIMSSTSAVIQMIPYIRQLVTSLRSLAVTQAIVAALSGPAGWARLGVGLAVAGVATAGIVAMSRGAIPNVVNIRAEAFTGNRSDARKFGGQVQSVSRESERLGR